MLEHLNMAIFAINRKISCAKLSILYYNVRSFLATILVKICWNPPLCGARTHVARNFNPLNGLQASNSRSKPLPLPLIQFWYLTCAPPPHPPKKPTGGWGEEAFRKGRSNNLDHDCSRLSANSRLVKRQTASSNLALPSAHFRWRSRLLAGRHQAP